MLTALACLPFVVAGILAPVAIVRTWRRYGSAVQAILSKEF